MGGRYSDDDDDALPWLEPADLDGDDEGEGGFPYRGLMLAGVSVVAVVALLWFVAVRFGGERDSDAIAATGDVPLIQAPDTPYKVRPDDPGGLDVDTGSLTHAVAGGADPGSQIALDAMPEEPVPVTRAPERLRRGADNMPTQIEPIEDDDAVKRPPTPIEKKPVPPEPAKPKPEATKAAPVPKPEPVKVAPAPKPAPPTPQAAGGSVTVQLGAFSSTATADQVWGKLAGRVPALGGLAKSVQSVESGGKTLYRLRASGIAAAEASALCSKVQAAGEQCAVVR